MDTLVPVVTNVEVDVARGRISVNGGALSAGDGLKVTDTPMLQFSAGRGAEVLVFNLPL